MDVAIPDRPLLQSSRFSPPRTTQPKIVLNTLLEQLLASPSGQVTVLCGPHGSGKTTALSALFERLREQQAQVYWLSLTPEDNQPEVLRKHLVSAFDLTPQADPEGFPDLAEHCIALIDGLEHLSNPISHALVEWFMLSLPASSKLYTCATRMRGALLHNARLRGLVQVIPPQALRFNDQHAQQLLGEQYLPHEVSMLNSFVQGWAAGLRFLQRNPEASRRLLSSRCSEPSLPHEMLEYFDVLCAERWPQATLQVLTQLSVFERFTAKLLQAMPQAPCTWSEVEEHISNGLFLDYVDECRQWVAFHPAFALYLRERLRRFDTPRFDQLKLFAAQWFLTQGQAAEAVHHATGLSCTSTAAYLIEQAGGVRLQVGSGRNTTLESPISAAQARELPLLFLSQLYQNIRRGRFQYARACMDQAWALTSGFTDIAPDHEPAQVQAWAYLFEVVLRVSADREDYDELLPRLETDMYRYLADDHVLAACIASILVFAGVEQGRYDYALKVCSLGLESLPVPDENRITIFLLLHKISAQLAVESVPAALNSSEQALRQARAEDMSDSYEVLSAEILHAIALYEQNRLDEAQQLLLSALERVRQINGWMRLYAEAFSVAAAIAGQRDGLEAAEQIIRSGERFAAERGYQRLQQLLGVCRLRELCRAQQWGSAMQLLNQESMQALLQISEFNQYQRGIKLAALLSGALMYLEMGRPKDCLAMLKPISQQTALAVDQRSQISLQLLCMRASFALRRFNAAFEHLVQALSLLRQGEFIYRTQEAGPYLAQVMAWAHRQNLNLPNELALWLQNHAPLDDAKAALNRHERQSSGAANFHLSPRETEIIGLIAQGLINKEIAARLGITEGTVKGHRKSIHEKLGVSSRSQAISRARELLLI